MTETDGLTPLECLARYDLDTRSWRTSQGSFPWDTSTPSLVTWPRSGSMRSGACWARTTLERPTGGSDSGYWPTPDTPSGGRTVKWHTPQAQDAKQATAPPSSRGRDLLAVQAHGYDTKSKKWPTPTSRDHKDGTAQSCANVPENALLGRAVHGGPQTPQTYPTPRAQDSYERSNKKTIIAANECGGAQLTLTRFIRYRENGLQTQRTWSTPRASDGEKGGPNMSFGAGGTPLPSQAAQSQEKKGSLNPPWVEWLMGWPVGWTSTEPMPPEAFRAWLSGFGIE